MSETTGGRCSDLRGWCADEMCSVMLPVERAS